ncbi:MAG: DUF2304 domain-containing protein [Acidimicrobiia bacterium]|nr:DUF2304 domain-containing protein [Acidimicrobiia bacterium]
MTDRVQVVALAGSVVLLLLVLELVRRRRLAEEYSALWIVSALVLIGISLRRDALDFAARWLGVYYPPAVLVLMLVAIISVASLSFSVILSRQQRQIDRLIEENAIMAAELRELRASDRGGRVGAVAAADVVADAAQRGAEPRPQ